MNEAHEPISDATLAELKRRHEANRDVPEYPSSFIRFCVVSIPGLLARLEKAEAENEKLRAALLKIDAQPADNTTRDV